MDIQRLAINILAAAGEGGIGKSTLTQQSLTSQFVRAGRAAQNRTCTVLDFADLDTSSSESLLLRVLTALGRLAWSWPAFGAGTLLGAQASG